MFYAWVVCFMIYLLNGCLILMHEIRVLDLGVGFLALWIFDPCIQWVKSFWILIHEAHLLLTGRTRKAQNHPCVHPSVAYVLWEIKIYFHFSLIGFYILFDNNTHNIHNKGIAAYYNRLASLNNVIRLKRASNIKK